MAVLPLVVGACSVGGPQREMMGSGSPVMGAQPGYQLHRPSCIAPPALPGSLVTVMLGDAGMSRMMAGTAPLGLRMMLHTLPASVRAGEVSLVASNMGWRRHEVVVLPLAPGQSAGERIPGSDSRVDERGSLGEVSTSCAAGSGEGIQPRTAGWTTLTLAPGRYELVCNLPHHYADGMYQELRVTRKGE